MKASCVSFSPTNSKGSAADVFQENTARYTTTVFAYLLKPKKRRANRMLCWLGTYALSPAPPYPEQPYLRHPLQPTCHENNPPYTCMRLCVCSSHGGGDIQPSWRMERTRSTSRLGPPHQSSCGSGGPCRWSGSQGAPFWHIVVVVVVVNLARSRTRQGEMARRRVSLNLICSCGVLGLSAV